MDTSPSTTRLTQAQSLIWTGQRLRPGVPLYNMVMAFHIDGPVDEASFTAAFRLLVAHTDVLRTTFEDVDGIPHRRVHQDLAVEVPVVDFMESPDPSAAYEAWSRREAARPFDLAVGAVRTALLRLAPDRHVWWLALHHLVVDGWSMALMFRRMDELYRAEQSGQVSVPEYPDFEFYIDFEERFRSGETHAEAMAYWDSVAAAPPPAPAFYGALPTAADDPTHTGRITSVVTGERRKRLHDLVEELAGSGPLAGMGQFTVMAAVLFALMSRVTGERDLAILAPAMNRPSQRFKNTAGLFMEVLPLHVHVERAETFRTLLDKVASGLRGLLLHALPGTSRAANNRGYSVLLNVINASFGDFGGFPVRSEWVHAGHGDADHKVRLQVHDFDETGEVTLHFDLASDVFDDSRTQALLRHFEMVLDALLVDLDTQIVAVDLRSETERRADAVFNDTAHAIAEPTVLEAFRRQVAETPDAVAVRGPDMTLTYRQLDERSDALARWILAVSPDVAPRVAVYLPRSVELVVALWATLKSGGAYVPIDKSYPAARIHDLLSDSGASAILTNADLASALGPVPGVSVLDPAGGAVVDRGVALPTTSPDAVAYVMYTSGSTGRPKGVMVTHRGLANYVLWGRREYARGGPVAFPFYSSVAFDLTVTSLYVPLVTGGEVVVYPEPEGSDLAILDVFAEDRVDVVKLTPAHLALLEPSLLDAARIRTLILGGEDLKTAVARAAWLASGGTLEIINEYGPTEATVGCMIHRFDPDVDTLSSVPIGRPATNMRIAVLSEDLVPAPTGVVGELCVSGPGVAAGYLDRPGLTDERFVADPQHSGERWYRTGDLARWRSPGEIEFLGRADDQVKVRGFRVELGEIEATLLHHPAIETAVVDVVVSEVERLGDPVDIVYCVRCGLASNHPDSHLDEHGVCKPCRFYDSHRGHAEDYFGSTDELRSILAEATRNDAGQDCVMLVSGGKDSTYALYRLVEMGMTPLVFHLDNGFIADEAKANIRRAVDDLGLEMVWGTAAAMNDIFADSLRRFSNVCQGCFKTIYTLGMNLARDRGLRHIVTGLSRGQIFETRLADLFRVGIVEREAVDAAIFAARRAYHRVDDAVRRALDTSAVDDDDAFDQIRIVDFYRYHDVGLDELYRFLDENAPWVRPADTGRSTNCLINNTGIFVHKSERRFHNYAMPYSWDVRLGHKTRDEALEELNDEIDVTQVRAILDEIGYEIEGQEEGVALMRGTETRLVAYYVADPDGLGSAELRAYLAERLPPQMVPSYLVPLEELPLTINGKVDRAALPDPRLRTVDPQRYVAPRTPLEERLAAVWQDVLGIDRIGVYDPFIELGGDSILNIQIVARAKAAGVHFTPQQLFEHETIGALAEVVTVEEVATPAPLPTPTRSGFSVAAFPEAGLSQAELDDLLETFGEKRPS